MRVSMLALALILFNPAVFSWAQTVNGPEGEKMTPQRPSSFQSNDQPPVQAQGSPQSPIASRYSFNRVENGFVRFDNTNGEIAYCSAQTAGWICQTVPIDRASTTAVTENAQKHVLFLDRLKAEIARLQNEVTSLKNEIAALKEPPAPRPPADLAPFPSKGGEVTIKLPTHEDMVRAREFFEETWRRLVEMLGTVRKDLMRKT
jgi:cell division protein FtsB